MYRISAEKGDIYAQYNLGAAYDDGKGILEDDTLAHMWWNLAGANGHKVAVENRKLLEEEMTESQI